MLIITIIIKFNDTYYNGLNLGSENIYSGEVFLFILSLEL